MLRWILCLPVKKKKHRCREMSFVSLKKIHPSLYIGNVDAAQKNIWTHVLCTAGCRHESSNSVTNCPFLDTMDIDRQPVWEAEYHIRNGALLLDIILRKKTNEESTVLVHCQAGMNRSASVIVAYAIGIGWTAQDAIDYVRSQNSTRLQVRPKAAAVTNRVFEFVLQNLTWHGLSVRSSHQ